MFRFLSIMQKRSMLLKEPEKTKTTLIQGVILKHVRSLKSLLKPP